MDVYTQIQELVTEVCNAGVQNHTPLLSGQCSPRNHSAIGAQCHRKDRARLKWWQGCARNVCCAVACVVSPRECRPSGVRRPPCPPPSPKTVCCLQCANTLHTQLYILYHRVSIIGCLSRFSVCLCTMDIESTAHPARKPAYRSRIVVESAHAKGISATRFSPDGRLLATCCTCCTSGLTAECRHVSNRHEGAVVLHLLHSQCFVLPFDHSMQRPTVQSKCGVHIRAVCIA